MSERATRRRFEFVRLTDFDTFQLVCGLEHDAPNAPLILCDFHRGQFGVSEFGGLRLLDVDSIRSIPEYQRQFAATATTTTTTSNGSSSNYRIVAPLPPRLYDRVACNRSRDCAQYFTRHRCMAVLRNSDLRDVKVRLGQDAVSCRKSLLMLYVV